jgi:hypothetical protein
MAKKFKKDSEYINDILTKKRYLANYLTGYLGEPVDFVSPDRYGIGSNIRQNKEVINLKPYKDYIKINNEFEEARAFKDSIFKTHFNPNIRKGNIKINDIRNVPSTSKLSHMVNDSTIRDIVKGSIKRNINPNTALAIALQETGIRKVDPLHQNDTPDLIDGSDIFGINDNLDYLVKKTEYAKKLGKTKEADIIQAWNGYGIINEHLYGRKPPINMNRDPVYGNRIIALRDSAINTTPEIQSIIQEEMKNKKFALGGIDPVSLGTSVASAAINMYNAAEAKADKKTADSVARNLDIQQRFENDRLFMRDFNTSGSTTGYYKNGGSFRLNARKIGNISNFKPIAPDTFVVNGPSHDSGGVKLGNNEVEGNEVIKITPEGIKVLSDRDDYFGYSPADNAKANPSKFNEEFIKQEMVKPMGSNNTNKAVIGNIFPLTNKKFGDYKQYRIPDFNSTEVGKVFGNNGKISTINSNILEAGVLPTVTNMFNGKFVQNPTYDNTKRFGLGTKSDLWNPSTNGVTVSDLNNIPTISNTSTIGASDKSKSNFGEKLPYFIDNVANAITTGMTPKVMPPSMIPLVKLNSDIDVNPMITSIKGNERSTIKSLNNNISDSNVATALGIGVGNQATSAINDIRSKELNMENQIKNDEAKQNLTVNARNAEAITGFQDQNILRQSGINSAVNENFNNLSRDFIDIRDRKNMFDKDIKRMGILLATDTEGSLSELIKSGDFDEALFSKDFNTTLKHRLSPGNLKAFAERQAMYKMNRSK